MYHNSYSVSEWFRIESNTPPVHFNFISRIAGADLEQILGEGVILESVTKMAEG